MKTSICINRVLLLVLFVVISYYCCYSFWSNSVANESNRNDAFSERNSKSVRDSQQMQQDKSVQVLFFNRIPKTGSEMLVLLLTWLQSRNDFKHVRLRSQRKRHLSREEQLSLVREVADQVRSPGTGKVSFDTHVHYLNFTALEDGHVQPMLMNIVREPIDKLISRFYYARVTPRPDAFTPPPQALAAFVRPTLPPYATLDQCLSVRGRDCTFIPGQEYDLTIPYFCGHEPYCRELGNRAALIRAKHNIERQYRVVGVLEDLNETLSVLEHHLPQFFGGVKELYYDELGAPHLNKNSHRHQMSLSPEAEAALRHNLTLELELYEFLRSRLARQHKLMQPP